MKRSLILASVMGVAFAGGQLIGGCSSSSNTPGNDAGTESDATNHDSGEIDASTTGSDSGKPGKDSGTSDDAPGNDGTTSDDGPASDDGGSDSASGDGSNCITLTVMNAPTATPWCNISVNGGAATTAATQTVCVTSGTSVTLTATPESATFELDPNDTWHDTTGDTGSGDPGTITGMTSATSVVVTSGKTCVWACCPFADGTGCPTTDQCP